MTIRFYDFEHIAFVNKLYNLSNLRENSDNRSRKDRDRRGLVFENSTDGSRD